MEERDTDWGERGTLSESSPQDEMPREKLWHLGRASLSDEELIAIFLRTGVPGCNVKELASKILQSVESLGQLVEMDAREICRLAKGIGQAKATTLAAVFELGKRAARASVRRPFLTNAKDVYERMVDALRSEKQEHMIVLNLSTQNQLIKQTDIGLGTLTRVIVHPRDIFRDAIIYGACRIIMVHNHPSGNPQPSTQDAELTSKIAEAGEILHIPLADHVVIGYGNAPEVKNYFSFREAGLI